MGRHPQPQIRQRLLDACTDYALEHGLPEAGRVFEEPCDLSGLAHPIPRTWVRLTEDHAGTVEMQDGFIANNTEFHNLIYRMSGNERVRNLARQLILPVYQMQLPHRMDMQAMHLSHRDHKVIAAALLAGNGDAAEAAMRRHIDVAGQGLKQTLIALAPVSKPVRDRAGSVG